MKIISEIYRKNGSRFAKVQCGNCNSISDRVIKGSKNNYKPRSNFCTKCKGKNTVEERKCLVCENIFKPRNYQIKQNQGKFCSQKCSLMNLHSLERSQEWKDNISKSNKGHKNAPSGIKHPFYKGGLIDRNGGYRFVLVKNQEYKAEHRLVMEEFLGRELSSDEIVHHKNHDKKDNRIENLEIMTRSEHMIEHMPEIIEARICKIR